MDHLSLKSVIRKKFKEMVVLGLGFTIAVGFFPVTSWADFQNSTKQTCGFNNQSLDGYLTEVSTGERIIMARGGNRSGGGGGGAMGQRRGGDAKNGCRYGTGDGTGYGAKTDRGEMKQRKAGNSEDGYRYNSRDGSGYGAKKEAGTGDRDGTSPKGNGRINQGN